MGDDASRLESAAKYLTANKMVSATAEMPGVEEIAKLISGAPFPSAKTLSKARAILALFAPILAENEAYRQNRHFVMGFNAGFDAAREQGLTGTGIRGREPGHGDAL